MNYWIFKCNPNRYRIDQRLEDPDPAAAWLVTRYRAEITPGDTAFIWRTGLDGGTQQEGHVIIRLVEARTDI